MSTSRYLDSVLKVMPAIQARQITDLLSDLQATGQIRNANEYDKKLKELATLINSATPRPSFRQVRALIWHLCSSDAHNTMMKALKNDLEALFLQVDEIGEKVESHHVLMMQELAAGLERNLREQENTIRRLEWLAEQNNEFSLGLVNSFASSSLMRMARSELESRVLYFDNRTYKNKPEEELANAVISEHGQKLILDVDNEPRVLPFAVRLLTDDNSYGTEIAVEVDNAINNLIDGTKGTFWTRDIYLSEAVPKVTTVLEFDFGSGKDLNYTIIESATSEPIYIDQIQAITPDGNRLTLLSSATEIDGWERIDFTRTLAKSIKIFFSTYSYTKAEYYTDNRANTHDVLDPNQTLEPIDVADALSYSVRQAIASDKLSNNLNIIENESQQVNKYLYSMSLDNVWFGNSKYTDSGIFVSKPLRADDIGVLAVRANETSETGTVQNTIEYEIVKIDRSPKYNETRFPIPKLGQATVSSERLVLIKRIADATINDVGMLRFCPYIAEDWDFSTDGMPITVYENGNALQIGTEWELAISASEDGLGNVSFDWMPSIDSNLYATGGATVFSNYTLVPQKAWIKINTPVSNAVYTVDYTIRTSDTHIDDSTLWLDKNKMVYLSDEGKVLFRKDDLDVVVTSDLYLQITLRRNLASQETSPQLHEYALLGAVFGK